MKPTPQQDACTENFLTEKNLRINAYAGTGKTSTLQFLAAATERSGTYMAFNKAIATEAKKKFAKSPVACSTTHSLAFRSVIARGYAFDKMTSSLSGGYLAHLYDYAPRTYADDVTITAKGYGRLVLETVQRYMRSGDEDLNITHASFFEGKLAHLPKGEKKELARAILRDARKVWDAMTDAASSTPMTHDGYLKLWALDRPQIDGDYIMLDEAQDTNGVVMELMRHQKAQLVTVGDKWQGIYGWRGAQNAMVELPTELESRLSTSFRFGPQVAGCASDILRVLGETLPLTGNPDRDDYVGRPTGDKPRAILARTNARLVEELVSLLEKGERPHIVGGTGEMNALLGATSVLKSGKPVDFPMMFFGFKDWADVQRAAESDEDSTPDLKRWVQLVDKHGLDTLSRTFSNLPSNENGATVVLSTGHKSKGREWDSVTLCDDFLRGVVKKDGEYVLNAPPPEDELMLLYVAATRAQTKLYIPHELTAKLNVVKEAA